jgi:hemoglobin
LAPPTVTRQNAGGLLRIPDQRCDSTEQSLYERLGGVNAIAMVVGRFSDKIVEDAKLNVNPQLQEWKGLVARPEVYADAVALCSGWGPFQYTGKELHEAHRDLRITSEEFDEVRQDIELLGRSVGVANGELEDLPGGNLPFIHVRTCMVMVLVPIGPLSRHVDATPNHHRGIALSRTIANASCNNLCLLQRFRVQLPRATRPGGHPALWRLAEVSCQVVGADDPGLGAAMR